MRTSSLARVASHCCCLSMTLLWSRACARRVLAPDQTAFAPIQDTDAFSGCPQ